MLSNAPSSDDYFYGSACVQAPVEPEGDDHDPGLYDRTWDAIEAAGWLGVSATREEDAVIVRTSVNPKLHHTLDRMRAHLERSLGTGVAVTSGATASTFRVAYLPEEKAS